MVCLGFFALVPLPQVMLQTRIHEAADSQETLCQVNPLIYKVEEVRAFSHLPTLPGIFLKVHFGYLKVHFGYL